MGSFFFADHRLTKEPGILLNIDNLFIILFLFYFFIYIYIIFYIYYYDFHYYYYSPNKRSFRGPGGVVRGLGSVRGPKSVHGNWPLWSPAWSPDYFSLGGSPESCAPPTLPPLSPALSPWPVVPRGSIWCHAWSLSGPQLF